MRRFLVLVAMLAVVSGCDESNDEVITVTPPLSVRETFPIDADSTGSPDDYSGIVDLTVTFDRETSASLISLDLFPAPVTEGMITTVNRRSWTLQNVELAAATGTYFWLVDGLRMPEPFVLKIRTLKRDPFTGFRGRIESTSLNQVDPRGTVVFALPADGGFNPLDPASFNSEPPQAVAVAFSPTDFDDLNEDYELVYLEFDTAYLVVAIKDTNGDLVYDPTQDWWGYYAVDGSITPVRIGVDQSPPSDPQFNGIVDIRLRPPVSP